jgi:hypothetical protein
MNFTIFYAWQSDRPENTHRYLIREAAKEAVKRIARDVDVEDSPRLDHDTKDVPGTPDFPFYRTYQELMVGSACNWIEKPRKGFERA